MQRLMAYHVTPAENLDAILRGGLQPRIGERSAELGELVPRVYLFPDLESCDTALAGWLGDCFEGVPEDGLLLLHVDVTGCTLASEVAYELTSAEAIEPARILEIRFETGAKLDVAPMRASAQRPIAARPTFFTNQVLPADD